MGWQVAELDRRLANLIRLGEVVAVDDAAARARVRLGEGLETPPIPWATWRAGPDHSWWPLETGEWVVVAAPSGDLAQAVIIGSLPTGRHPPHGKAGVWRQSFADGSFVQFSGGDFTIHATGQVRITGQRIELN